MTLEDLYRLLRTSHEQAQGIVDTLDEPLLLLDGSLCVVSANPAFLRCFKVDRESTIGHSLFSLGNGQWDIPELRRLFSEVIPKTQAIVGFEVSHDFPSIGQRTMLVSARRLVHPDNNSTTLLAIFEDVTELRKASAATDLLLAESRHRIKNMVAVAHGIAYGMPIEGLTAKEFREIFLGRLEAFLSAKDMVEQSAEAGVELATLIEDAMRHVGSKQLKLECGPSLQLEPQCVRPLRMIFHELLTNALKYGALSSANGVVHLSWRTVDEAGKSLELLWSLWIRRAQWRSRAIQEAAP